jgi:myo-inositol-1(or 4)-monophosphatase
MPPPVPDIQILRQLLIDAANRCLPGSTGATDFKQFSKPDGSLVTEVDANLQNFIQLALKQHWPDIPMLGEEMSHLDQAQKLRSSARGLWVLDPLDGTTNFTVGFPVYGISLAYVKDGQSQLAVIYDPNRKECFSAIVGEGAYLNGQRLQAAGNQSLSSCVANIDYKRLTAALANRLVSCPPYRSQRNMGSCVLEWCWLAANRIQLYLHGGQHLWDHAAGRLILSEAGGIASRLEGKPLKSDKLIKQSAVAASSPALYAVWYEWLQQQG